MAKTKRYTIEVKDIDTDTAVLLTAVDWDDGTSAPLWPRSCAWPACQAASAIASWMRSRQLPIAARASP